MAKSANLKSAFINIIFYENNYLELKVSLGRFYELLLRKSKNSAI
jgi:hypothetical protein